MRRARSGRVRDDCETLSTRETNSSDAQSENPVEGGVLAALPRTRPQRASPRRAAARTRAGKASSESADASTATGTHAPASASTSKSPSETNRRTKPARKVTPTKVKAKPSTAKAKPKITKTKSSEAKPSEAKPTPLKAKAASPKTKTAPIKKPAEAPAPKQGYEPEEDVELGKTINPPGGVELVESVADIFGELANSSLAAGGRILKDAFSLLRRP